MTDIAIIGGGHVGRTLLTDLVATRGLHHMNPELLISQSNNVDIGKRIDEASGTIRFEEVLSGATIDVEVGRDLFGSLDDVGATETLTSAQMIFVTVPDIPSLRLEIFDKLAKIGSLKGKTIVLVKAGQASQPVIANMINQGHPLADADIVLAESFYGTRADRGSIIGNRKLSINIAILSRAADQALERVRRCFPLGTEIDKPSWPDFSVVNAIDLLFVATAYFLHVAVVLHPRNLALTRAAVQYSHYLEGIDRELAQQLDAIDKERIALGCAYGLQLESFPQVLNRQYGLTVLPDFFEMMQSCKDVYKSMPSPKSIHALQKSRHILEDVAALYTIEWLMQRAGISMPETAAYIQQVNDVLPQIGVDRDALAAHRPLLAAIQGGPSTLVQLLNAPHVQNRVSASG